MGPDREVKKQRYSAEDARGLISRPSDSCIRIDGSQGEGGGQILRNAISYACIFQEEVYIDRIRGGRPRPGLHAQHVIGLRLAASICGGALEGATKDSTAIHFVPPSEQNAKTLCPDRTLIGDTGTAGSICLLLQAALPCALFGDSLRPGTTTTLILKGGTNASMAPQYDYWELVFLPVLQTFMNIDPQQIQAQVIRRGYFPRGGGEVHVRIRRHAAPLQPLRLTEQGDVQEVYIRSFHAGKLGRRLAQQMASACSSYLKPRLGNCVGWKEDIVTETSAVGNGLGLLVVARTTTGCLLAGSSLCQPQTTVVEAGEAAAAELWRAIGAGGCVDDWLQDQLVLFMALADGPSEVLTGSLTLHTRTAIQVAACLTTAVFDVRRLDDPEGAEDLTDSHDYGATGRHTGRHLIRCSGGALRQSIKP